MPSIIITKEAHFALMSCGVKHDTSTPRSDGTVSVPVSQDTLERLHENVMEGETISDAIIRLSYYDQHKAN